MTDTTNCCGSPDAEAMAPNERLVHRTDGTSFIEQAVDGLPGFRPAEKQDILDEILTAIRDLTQMVDKSIPREAKRSSRARPAVDRTRAILQSSLGIADDTAKSLKTEAMAQDAADFIALARRISDSSAVQAGAPRSPVNLIPNPAFKVGLAGWRTAEPAVEQIAEVAYLHTLWAADWSTPGGECGAPECEWASDAAGVDRRDAHNRHLAEEIHALWSPIAGDADEGGNGVSWKDRAGKNEALWREAEARADRLEAAVAAARHNYANLRDGRLNDTLVENQHLRAALEAAEALMRAQGRAIEAERELLTANRVYQARGTERFEAQDAYDAARAAVKAEAGGESGA